jgi:hypothetical protein
MAGRAMPCRPSFDDPPVNPGSRRRARRKTEHATRARRRTSLCDGKGTHNSTDTEGAFMFTRRPVAAASIALALLASSNCDALTFDFSFSDDGSFAPFNTAGTVTGTITGLTDNTVGEQASHVYIDSYPSALGLGLATPFDTIGDSLQGFNAFSVSNGQIVDLSYLAQNNTVPYGLSLNVFGGNSLTGSILSTGDLSGLSGIAFTPVPEPSTWAMMLLGFAGLGFAGYRAGRTAQRPA